MHKRLLVLAVAACFSACTVKTGYFVNPAQIDYANDMCEKNGGLKHISDANDEAEIIFNNMRGVETGRVKYDVSFECNNHAIFHAHFVK